MPSRYQEGLKKTKELQDLREEEEEQKSESLEEPEEAAETEEEEKEQRSRLQPSQLLTWASVPFTAQHPWRGQSKAVQGPSEQPTGGNSCWRKRQRESQRVQIVNKEGLPGFRGQGCPRVGSGVPKS